MQLFQKMKKNRKGFTLVEIIVVLVILAILAAFTIPAMLGFVNEARGKAYIAEAREVYVAYQAAASEVAGSTGTTALVDGEYTNAGQIGDKAKADVTTKAKAYFASDITLAAAADQQTSTSAAYKVTIVSNKVTEVKYSKNGYTVDMNLSTNNTTVGKNADMTS